MPTYAVTCCGRLVARLDDDRPGGGLGIASAPGSTALVLGMGIEINGVQPYEMSQEQVTRTWAESAVSQTVWENGHITWTIRCRECSKQAEMTETNYLRIADALLTGTQHEIPLSMLCVMLSRFSV
ncbi:hypothetical protein MFM001_35840 [Mycobacterium sp. MFM001]|uniref:hypothetical protein n=1 Tax=Mycobacterium sp. MFM001 TaxID=2049453 RepID=UPI000DA4F45D|nr:hypothetical protein [Mycobacterium sp. MFM001]GBE67122.1 hypothetical protein MFM001_35840 [Mycobacterium sp. MFM001]